METNNMIVVMQEGATETQIQGVIDRLVELGFDVHRSTGVIHTVLGGVGGRDDFDLADQLRSELAATTRRPIHAPPAPVIREQPSGQTTVRAAQTTSCRVRRGSLPR